MRRAQGYSAVMDARRVSLFRNGRSQTLWIPDDLELPSDEAVLRQDGDRLTLEPAQGPTTSLLALLATWEPIEDDFGEDLPPAPVDL